MARALNLTKQARIERWLWSCSVSEQLQRQEQII